MIDGEVTDGHELRLNTNDSAGSITSLTPFTVNSSSWSSTITTVSSSSTTSSICGEDEEESSSSESRKDPRRIARGYQLELCKKALEENIIVYLETGCGKTHIAVLLIYEMGHLIRKPNRSVCIFLAPTVALVEQQAKVIEDSTDFKVKIYCGNSKHLKSHHDWEKEIEEYEVLVMTPQILLRNLSHCFIRMELISLLIFDECHHAQVQSNHPYAEIMRMFYKTNASKLPRIFGMTASPVVGKGASNQASLPKSINSLEKLLVAKVYSVEDKDEMELFVASPVVKVYLYGPVANNTSSFYTVYCRKLEDLKRQCISMLSQKTTDDHKSLLLIKKSLRRIHDNLIFCLENLGLWGVLQATRILLSGDHHERDELMEEAEVNFGGDSLCDKYLTQAHSIFSDDCVRDGTESDISCVEVLKEPFFSKKLLRLIGILSTFRPRPNMKCIIFVNRIVTARSLSYILQKLKFLASWKCNFLVGVHAGLKSMSRKTTNSILEKFRSGELNLLIATRVGEEGLDIQTCCLVIRFDLPETVASFIQSRGRARMPQSEYAFLVDSGNKKELDLIENFKINEDRMNKEIASRTSSEAFGDFEDRIYKVDSSGASISSGYSISLLHHYCSKLPHDEYYVPKLEFFYFDDSEGTVCSITFPSNASIRRVVSKPQSSIEAAKKDACLKACEELHKLDALSDYLLPGQANANEEQLISASIDSDSCEEDGSRAELHEMLVPASLKESWNDNFNYPAHLSCYYLNFTPIPGDRLYKRFGLFVKAPLPGEAERMKVDLHLAHGRSVLTELVPLGVVKFDKDEGIDSIKDLVHLLKHLSLERLRMKVDLHLAHGKSVLTELVPLGVVKFYKDEIMQAQKFQEMFLKVTLDRSELKCDSVCLGKNNIYQSSPTFYLLLPVILHDCKNTLTVDWKIIMRCLSSPVFRTPANSMDNDNLTIGVHLQLADGTRSVNDIVDSLVYVPYKKSFFFVNQILYDKDGSSKYKESISHVQHLSSIDIHLSYPGQPLLKAKQLFSLRNLLHDRKKENSESLELEEHFFEIPPELCVLKIIAFSKDMGSSISLLPSIMHRLENFLVAVELQHTLSASFPEGAEVTAQRVFEALTTEKCNERLSLERLEVLGDAFLKFAVGRRLFLLHGVLDEGGLTSKRSNDVDNSNLHKLSTSKGLQVYIRDQPFDPCQFYAFGRPCPVICNKETERSIHTQSEGMIDDCADVRDVRCNKYHHLLQKKTIADVVEALIGAFLVDSGFKAATAFLKWIGIQIEFQASQVTDICRESSSYLQLASCMDFPALENLLGYRFVHRGLLLQAFLHPSYTKHGGGCYQRLEFLGDAVMDYLVTSYLYSAYPDLKPGQFTDLRSASVSNKAFANIAVCKSFHKFLICDSSCLSEAVEKYVEFMKTTTSQKSMLEGPKCPKVLGDLVESCIGAILLDTGFNLNHVWKTVLSFLDPIMNFSTLQLNPIRELHELCQGYNWNLQFSPSKKGNVFSVEGKVSGVDICAMACASNRNKKDALRIVAQKLCFKLKAQGFVAKSNSLEKDLKSCRKMEGRLIGYDETPVDVISLEAIKFENLNELEPSRSTFNPSASAVDPAPCIRRMIKNPIATSEAAVARVSDSIEDNCSNMDSQIPGTSQKKSAKSRLHELCAVNYWQPPIFECCEEGPSHLKLFTYKVAVDIEEASDLILEGVGAPSLTKKAAAEHAAEGVLCYLAHKGYLPKKCA